MNKFRFSKLILCITKERPLFHPENIDFVVPEKKKTYPAIKKWNPKLKSILSSCYTQIFLSDSHSKHIYIVIYAVSWYGSGIMYNISNIVFSWKKRVFCTNIFSTKDNSYLMKAIWPVNSFRKDCITYTHVKHTQHIWLCKIISVISASISIF